MIFQVASMITSCMSYEVLKEVKMSMMVFWDVRPSPKIKDNMFL
jgi:hypothetical protein